MRQTKLQRHLRFQEMIGLTDKTQLTELFKTRDVSGYFLSAGMIPVLVHNTAEGTMCYAQLTDFMDVIKA